MVRISKTTFAVLCLLTAISLATSVATIAPAQVDFSASVSFGDSLTHNELIGFPFRIGLYGDDPAQTAFKKGRQSGDRLRNYAIAGSTSSTLPAQFVIYAGRVANQSQPLATFISYEIGGNDILNNYGKLSRSAPGVDPAADKVINDLLANTINQLYTLYVFHPTARFLIWTVPDVSFTPKEWATRATPAGNNVRAHIKRVNDVLRSLEVLRQVAVLDTERVIQSLASAPPTINNRTLIGPPAYGQRDHLFADSIHPTAVANAILGNFIIARMNQRWNVNIPQYTTAELAALARIP